MFLTLIIPMTPALLALAGMTVALVARHPAVAGGGAAASVTVFAGLAAGAAVYGYREFAVLLAVVAAANVLLGVSVVRDARRARAAAEREREERRARYARHDVAVDNIAGGAR